MTGPTKEAVEHVALITKQTVSVVKSLLNDGWTFSWDIRGNWRWEKNTVTDDLEPPVMTIFHPTEITNSIR